MASENQPLATGKQANHYQAWVHQQEWKPLKTTLHMAIQYANTVRDVLCMSSDLNCGYIAGIQFCV